LLGRRGATFDLEAVARAAAANGTFLEINANAHRLDLSDVNVKKAAALGARFCINPDAHATTGFDDTPLGVMVARRAGLEVDQVFNAQSKEELLAALARRQREARARLHA
jgi:DNA polymerase (family 10)